MSRTETQNELYDAALKLASASDADYERLAPLLGAAHESGDARATYALATWYLHGRVFKKSLRKAIALLRAAAAKNMADALYDLAVCYENGEGVPRNDRKAVQLYLRAALQGDRQSVYEVGRCYYYGIGVGMDRSIARVWFDSAGELGIQQ